MKKVSIITITYNSEATIEDTIKSVISQDYPEIEYIIVDGVSKDSTLEIVEKYRDKIAKVISEPDKGICDAFNKGIKAATGEIIGIINSDDMLMPGAISRLVSVMKDDVEILYGNGQRLFEDGHMKRYPAENYKKLTDHMALVHPATFVRKSAYERYGMFDLKYKACMDRELLLRMYKCGATFQFDDYDYAIYRMGGYSDRTFETIVTKEREEISIRYGANIVNVKLKSFITAIKHNLQKKIRCGD